MTVEKVGTQGWPSANDAMVQSQQNGGNMLEARMKSSEATWQDLYRAALFETNRTKAAKLIDDAEKAAMARIRVLPMQTKDFSEERDEIDDALYALRALRSSLVWENSLAKAA